MKAAWWKKDGDEIDTPKENRDKTKKERMEYWVARELHGQVQWETKSFQVNHGVEQELRKAKAGKKRYQIRNTRWDRKEKQCESRDQETEGVIFMLNVWK